MSCQLICTVIAGLISSLDWPSKTTPKWLLTSWNPLTSSQVTVISCHVSWFVQLFLIRFHHWIGLEKLPQIDSSQVEIHPLVPKLQWFLLHVSWFVQQLCWFEIGFDWDVDLWWYCGQLWLVVQSILLSQDFWQSNNVQNSKLQELLGWGH